jgi:putative lipoic acid-binding regulatory protein
MSDDDIRTRESSKATLEETHDFPCPYQFKVIGDNSEEFVAQVVQVGVNVGGTDTEPEVSTRESSSENYVSVTMELEVENAETILDVYDRVKELDGVQFVL